eukprot:jgi/Tetstr1/442035/TSEL_030216.t1
MDLSAGLIGLLLLQCMLMSLMLLHSVMTAYLHRGVGAYKHPLAKNAAALISLITADEVTNTAAVAMLEKTLESEKATEAAVAFVQRITRRLLEDTLQMYEVPPEGAGHSLKQAVPFQARPQPVSNGQDDGGLGEGGLTEDGPASPLPRERTHGGTVNADVAAMELLVAESVERIKRVVVSTCDGRLITDVIVRNVMDVIQDPRVEEGCVTMMAHVLARPEVTEAISSSITGVGSNMVNRIIPQRLWSNKSIAKESRD